MASQIYKLGSSVFCTLSQLKSPLFSTHLFFRGDVFDQLLTPVTGRGKKAVLLSWADQFLEKLTIVIGNKTATKDVAKSYDLSSKVQLVRLST